METVDKWFQIIFTETTLWSARIVVFFGGGYSLKGGMPGWRYAANQFRTLVENIVLGVKFSEYRTGYRAFSRKVREQALWEQNSDDFIFDNQTLAQVLWHGHTIAEVSCPKKYLPESSSINAPSRIIWIWRSGRGVDLPIGEMGFRAVKTLSAHTPPLGKMNSRSEPENLPAAPR